MAKKAHKVVAPVTFAVALVDGLEPIAAQVAGALQETVSLAETLGDLTREAHAVLHGAKLTDGDHENALAAFVATCRALVVATGMEGDSIKVYLSNMRGVLRAMNWGYVPADGAALRAMYNAIPDHMKTGKGRQKKGASLPNGGKATRADEDDDSDLGDDAAQGPTIRTVTPADLRKGAVTTLFGHHDDELQAAVDWASKNEGAFIRYVKAMVEAEQRNAADAKRKSATKVVVGELEKLAA